MRVIQLAPCVIAAAVATQAVARSKEVTVPSGQNIRLHQRLIDPDGPNGLTWRYRFVAPAIGRADAPVTVEDAFADMQALCDTLVAPEIQSSGSVPNQIIISFMDRIVAFGQTDPDSTQFFEAFRVENGACTWEAF